jgi:uncharacterized protein (TIGR00369 family)
MEEVVKYHKCFVCGDKNEIGLKARFYFDGEQATSEIVADELFAGYHGIYHGGIISTMLDEVMIKALLARGIFAVTAELTVKFKRPVRTGDKVLFSGREVTSARDRIFTTEGRAQAADGTLYAEATGKYIAAGPDLREELERSID